MRIWGGGQERQVEEREGNRREEEEARVRGEGRTEEGKGEQKGRIERKEEEGG